MPATVSLAPIPKLRFSDNNGNPAAGFLLFTYASRSTTKQNTYTDATGATPNANPVILDSRGEGAVWVDDSLAYKFVLAPPWDTDPPTNPVWTIDGVPSVASAPSNAASGIYTSLANAASASFGPGLVGFNPTLAYVAGTVGERLVEELTTTGFITLQAAVTAAAGKRLRIIGSWMITSAVTVPSNTTLVFNPSATITTSTVDINMLDLTGQSNVRIVGPGKLQMTGIGTAGNIGMVNMDGSTSCSVSGLEMQGNQWAGVRMNNAINCSAVGNYIHESLGTVQDAAGVTVYRNCDGCLVEGNRLLNTGYHGVLVQGPGSGTFPVKTRVLHNDIDGATSYGIISYQIDANNTYTLIHGNRVKNITGATTSGSAGAGVYIQNSGGVRCIGNAISNVCTATTNNTLAPAGVAVNNIGGTLIPPVIEGNTIADVGLLSAGGSNPNAVVLSGINISSSANGATLVGNTIRQSAGLTPQFLGIYINASSNVTCVAPNINIANSLPSSHGIFAFANGLSISNIVLAGVNIVGGDFAGVRVDQSAAFTISNFSLQGGSISGGSANMVPIRLAQIAGGSIGGVVGSAIATFALSVSGCTQLRVGGCALTTTGATAVTAAGVCSGSSIDKSVYWGAAASLMNNTATGLSVEWRSNAAPASGTWAVGDRTEQSVPVVGNPKGWRTTVAGTPGTHVSEGNL